MLSQINLFKNALLFQPFVSTMPFFFFRPVTGIKFEMIHEMNHLMDKRVKFLCLNIYYVLCVLLWLKYWLMWFESILVFISFKFLKKNVPTFSGIRVVKYLKVGIRTRKMYIHFERNNTNYMYLVVITK